MDTTTVHVETRRSAVDQKPIVSEFRRALPQFCVVGVKNLILFGNVTNQKIYYVNSFLMKLKKKKLRHKQMRQCSIFLWFLLFVE